MGLPRVEPTRIRRFHSTLDIKICAHPCLLAFRAEYILTSIGAGATATSTIDWHEVWLNSPEADELEKEIEEIHIEGRSRPPVETAQKHEFATPWFYQMSLLFRRECEAHWRDPTYLMAKIALNIVAGLFIGFTFFKAKDSIQGTQNHLFVRVHRSSCQCLAYLYISP